jgi:hypothetical protein
MGRPRNGSAGTSPTAAMPIPEPSHSSCSWGISRNVGTTSSLVSGGVRSPGAVLVRQVPSARRSPRAHLRMCRSLKECFGAKFRSLQPAETSPVDTRLLRPWNSIDWLQGRIHPIWETTISAMQAGWRDEDSNNGGHHPAAPPGLDRDVVRHHLVATVPAGH